MPMANMTLDGLRYSLKTRFIPQVMTKLCIIGSEIATIEHS